eukprot:15432240-Alexandrium_andersonii.AAC.1
MLGRWQKRRAQDKWDELPRRLAESHKELPNHIRQTNNLPRKGRSEDWCMPMDLQRAYDKILVSRVQGTDPEAPLNEPMRCKNIMRGMTAVINRWNEEVDEENTKRKDRAV